MTATATLPPHDTRDTDRASARRSGRRRRGARRVTWYVVVSAASLLALYPFLMMVFTGLKPEAELSDFPPTFLPHDWQWGNFVTAATSNGFPRQLLNSLIYACGSMVGNVLFCSLAGYAFAKMRFPGNKVLFGLVLALLMVPAQSQIVPVFIVLQHIPFAGGNNWAGMGGSGLLDTYIGLIMPSVVTPLGIFLMRQFFLSIPGEYAEAGRIDGASTGRIFANIMLPLARPAAATLAILSFQSAWNNFVWPLILTSDTSKATLQLGLQLYQTGQDARTNLLLAASTLTVIPMIALFLAAQRHFVGGISAGLK